MTQRTKLVSGSQAEESRILREEEGGPLFVRDDSESFFPMTECNDSNDESFLLIEGACFI